MRNSVMGGSHLHAFLAIALLTSHFNFDAELEPPVAKTVCQTHRLLSELLRSVAN